MNDELYIDDDGRFQLPSEALASSAAYLLDNHVICDLEDASTFESEGRSYGFARLQHPYDLETTRDHYQAWRRAAKV